MKRILQDERGMALAVAIFALVVIGALVAGAFFAGTQEQRVAENSRRVTQSFGIADAGVAEVVRGWDPATINQRGIYPADSVRVSQVASPAGSGEYGGYVYKLNGNMYLVDVSGVDNASLTGNIRGGGARQRLGLITRVRPLQVDIQASLTTQGGVNVQGNAEVDGNDQNPTGWTSCDAPDTNRAGVRDKGGTVTTGGNGTVYGNPPVWSDPTLNDSTFTEFGDVNYNELAAMANITLGPGTYKTFPTLSNGACDKNDQTNWGDGINKTAPCGSYFPIIHIAGDVTLNGDQGQGILLVDGNLDVQGSYEWFGIVIILGDLKTSGGGSTAAHFWGGVMAKNANLDTQNLTGKATLNFSKCAITQALQNTQATSSLRSRGWVQLF
jgi:hypothetical protein